MKTTFIMILLGPMFMLSLTSCQNVTANRDIGTLSSIQNDITKALPNVAHISSDDLQNRLSTAPQNTLVFDTRPVAEYSVSHINTAHRVDPDIAPQDLTARYDVVGKDVVLYCSVGWRSSLLGEATREALLYAGAKSVRNLEGGLFGWHNEGRAVVNATGPTIFIHPYDNKWGQLIKNTDAARYTP